MENKNKTTIAVSPEIARRIKDCKITSRESYDEILNRKFSEEERKWKD